MFNHPKTKATKERKIGFNEYNTIPETISCTKNYTRFSTARYNKYSTCNIMQLLHIRLETSYNKTGNRIKSAT